MLGISRQYRFYLIFIGLSWALPLHAQVHIKGQICDAITKDYLPFVTIKLGNSNKGITSDMKGRFELILDSSVHYLQFSYIGYESKLLNVPQNGGLVKIMLKPKQDELTEVVIKAGDDKVAYIINRVIANKTKNNPEAYIWYQCDVYYKMLADLSIPDSLAKKDTGHKRERIKEFTENQHLLVSETYSQRTHSKPDKYQEKVVSSRLSGFKNIPFVGLVTDVLPFHSYGDFIVLNAKDYHSPLSKGYKQHYQIKLEDSYRDGWDTVWVLSFKPKTNQNELKGIVHIHSGSFAITKFVANNYDADLDRTVGLEQEYRFFDTGGGGGLWFPKELNYSLNMKLAKSGRLIMSGHSDIDRVNFVRDDNFIFDKQHSIIVNKNSDGALDTLRPKPLDDKEKRTYVYDDSVMKKMHGERIMNMASKLPDLKMPIGLFDMDLRRLIRFNLYENTRLGMGLQTNEKVLQHLSLGAWAGYGFNDKAWKYGAFLNGNLGKYNETQFSISWYNDIQDPGRILLHPELDKTGLMAFLLNRVDSVSVKSLSFKKQLGYLNVKLTASDEYASSKYNYALYYNAHTLSRFHSREVSLNLRYANAERFAPVFNSYQSMGTSFPIAYAKIIIGNTGDDGSGFYKANYLQAIAAIAWVKHSNRWGTDHILLQAAKVWSNEVLPLAKLFAGNGLRYDAYAFYSFGGFMTAYPYTYYSDEFCSLNYTHDFDFKLYNWVIAPHKISSAPSPALAINVLNGSMQNRALQRTDFTVPYRTICETGVLMNNIYRFNYQLYYITLHAGYFYRWDDSPFKLNTNGRFVLGAGVEF